jgi:hypothetical protein
MPKKRPTRTRKTASRKKAKSRKKTLKRKKTTSRKVVARLNKVIRRKKSAPRKIQFVSEAEAEMETFSSITAGQSGDIQGLSRVPEGDSESVEELVEEGQAFEAGVLDGVENAPDADEAEVTTKEVPEDDVPLEYQDKD